MKQFIILALMVIVTTGCATDRLINNKQTLAKVAQRVAQRQVVLPEGLTDNEKQAMEFLYAYMPIGDRADYEPQLFLSNVRSAIKAREQMSWGKSIPEELFLHFVLPIRVNNETLDSSRVEFFAELKDRVKGMSMADAILEVNHWCHEKVVYTPTDGRTSAPGALVRSATGRCGEESTFATYALRAVGIPARQIYTGRWAHTDDNHAWVEAWADGKWHYIGACEPEPILDMGWFDSPVKRGMIMFTKVFGEYDGKEEIIAKTDGYTEINVTENYAPVKQTTVQVLDTTGKVVAGAEVIYSIYNYAEFYPSVRLTTTDNGTTSFSSGLGDMVIWANKGDNYGYGKLDVRTMDTLTVILDKAGRTAYTYCEDVVPPKEGVIENRVSSEQRAENNRRFAVEDSIRGAYVATFTSRKSSDALSAELSLNADKLWEFISKSRGNHAEVVAFLKNTPSQQLSVAMSLLGVISQKDLRDTPEAILRDHLTQAYKYKDEPYFVEYILNPRVDNELLTAYRTPFVAKGFTSVEEANGQRAKVVLRPELNPSHLAITPLGIDKMMVGDEVSASRYLITLLRSSGIASRRAPITQRLEYFDKATNKWVNVDTEVQKTAPLKGTLKITLAKNEANDNPRYALHFSIARLDGGQYHTLGFATDESVDMGQGDSFKAIFAKPVELEVGQYQLITGTRMADGSVLSKVDFFEIHPSKQTSMELTLRTSENKLQVIGNFDPEALYIPKGATEEKSVLSTTGRGYFILALMDAKKEPTTHMLRQMQNIKARLESWGRPIVLVLRDKQQMESFSQGEFKELPSSVSFGYDSQGKTASMMEQMLKLKDMASLPILVLGDSFGRVIYKSQGYNTTLGEQLTNVISALENGTIIK
ncbi:MAG: transglutaminase-like domain-containing protein [Mucinivorans sp.]